MCFKLYIGVHRQNKADVHLEVCYHYRCKVISRKFYSNFHNILDLCVYIVLHF